MKSTVYVILSLILISMFGAFTINASQGNFPYLIKMFTVSEKIIPNAKSYRRDWHRLTGFEHSGLHWDQFVVVFTDKGEEVYKHNFLEYIEWFDDPDDEDNLPNYRQYPVGTKIIKENFTIKNGTPDEPNTLAAMIKHKKGYDLQFGDWEYVQLNVNGDIILRGKGSNKVVQNTCANCHNSVADRDFIFGNFYTSTKGDKQ